MAMMSDADLTCPFCKETGFDRIGLYGHFERGWCEEFPKIEEERRIEEESLAQQSVVWRAESEARKAKEKLAAHPGAAGGGGRDGK